MQAIVIKILLKEIHKKTCEFMLVHNSKTSNHAKQLTNESLNISTFSSILFEENKPQAQILHFKLKFRLVQLLNFR